MSAAADYYERIGTLRLVRGLAMFFVGFSSIAWEFLFSQPGSPLWS